MRLVRDGKIYLKKNKGFKPINIPNDRERIPIELGGVYGQSSNWTWVMRRDVESMASTNQRKACFSGIGSFMWIGPLILDGSNLQILTIAVRDGRGNLIYMVSDMFDTPKCPRQYKTFRMQWRKVMYNIVNSGHKIVKMPHRFMQKFKLEFNYVPSINEMAELKTEMLYNARSGRG